ncbi:MAG: ribosome-associated translation inhibitor RaiA [Patescibacteria group bacterium]
MNIRIQSIGIELTAAIRARAEEKVRMLEKFMHAGGAVEADVEVGRTTAHHHKGQVFFCEIHLRIPGEGNIRSREEHEDLYAAIDEVQDELQRQLVDLKEKRIAQRRR